MKSYCWDAEDYRRHSSAQQAWARELIRKLDLHGGEDILDIGCGDGKVSAEMASYVPKGHVVGIDNSLSMIQLARTEYPSEDYPNLSFQLVDVRQLPFKEQFDVVFSSATLHWVRNHKPVLEGIWKSLRRGGRILLQMGGEGNAAPILSVLDRMIEEENWRRFFEGFEFPYGFHNPENYVGWLEESGFNPVRVELIPKDMKHDGKSELTGWIRTTWLPYTERVPENQREVFVDQLADRYMQEYLPDSECKTHIHMVRLEVEATKNA